MREKTLSRTLRDFAVVTLIAAAGAGLGAQAGRKPPARRPAPPALTKSAANLSCPSPLGAGVMTKLAFCDILTGRNPVDGVRIKIPPHAGPATLSFDLHNRHTYSEEEVRSRRSFARYTATIGVLTLDNTLLDRGVVQNEFRTAADLIDRVGGGAGPAGVKAVAPTGNEPIAVTIPAGIDEVSILGEKLTVERLDGSATYSAAGRPIAVMSNARVEYRAARAVRKRR